MPKRGGERLRERTIRVVAIGLGTLMALSAIMLFTSPVSLSLCYEIYDREISPHIMPLTRIDNHDGLPIFQDTRSMDSFVITSSINRNEFYFQPELVPTECFGMPTGYMDDSRIDQTWSPTTLEYTQVSPTGTPHDPIIIDGDRDFKMQARNEGWLGKGTKKSPYIIEDFYINLAGEDGNCIDIRNIASTYFIIRNCEITGATAPDFHVFYENGILIDFINARAGIYLYNVLEAALCENQCSENLYGIILDETESVLLKENICDINYASGILLQRSSRNVIQENTCIGNTWDGIALIDDSLDNDIIGNDCTFNGGGGIFVGWGQLGCDDNTLFDNDCLYNDFAGISVGFWPTFQNSVNNLLTDNECHGNLYGIYLGPSSGSTKVIQNICNENFAGVLVDRSDSNEIIDSIFSYNFHGIELDDAEFCNLSQNRCVLNDGSGILLMRSNKNIIFDNFCSTNIWDGIDLWDGSSSNEVIENQCISNLGNGLAIGGWQYAGCHNVVQGNRFEGNGATGIHVGYFTNTNEYSDNNTILENDIIDNFVGIVLHEFSHSTIVRDNYCEGNEFAISFDNTDGNIVTKNSCVNNDWGIFVLYGSSSNEIIDNDCMSNINVGIIIGYESPGCSDNIISGNDCSNNGDAGIVVGRPFDVYGISSNNYLYDNVCDGNGAGIIIDDYSEHTILELNTCNDNLHWGILVMHSPLNEILNNEVANTVNCYWLEYSDSNYISGNIAYGEGAGFFIGYSFDNILEDNTAEECSHGFWLKGSSDCALRRNTALNSVWRGFWLWDSNYNVLESNLASYTYFYGSRVPRGFEIGPQLPETEVDSSTGNELFDNTAENYWRGFTMIIGAPDNYLHDNIAMNNNVGFFLWATSGNVLEENHILNNNAGINVWEEANDNTFVGNIVEGNGHGIGIYYASGNLIYHNHFIGNTVQAWDNSPKGTNHWYHPALLEGNYWYGNVFPYDDYPL
jgi:parallel beta-helix repeat protein